jgi:protein-disulfide isomerase
MEKETGMKKIWLAIALLGFFFCSSAWAEVSLTTLRELNLERGALDVASSADGQTLFILVPGEIVVYSVPGNQVEKKIQVDNGFDRITYLPGYNGLVLAGGETKVLKILKLQDIYQLDISGLPFWGPENAPVTMVVFSDYQ